MRRTTIAIGSRLQNPQNPTTKSNALTPFSTFSGSGGDGRGRGRGAPTPRFSFVPPPPPKPDPDDDPLQKEPPGPPGLGHGRGRSLPPLPPVPPSSSPNLPSFTSFGAGRGAGVAVEGRFPFHPGRGQRDPPPPEDFQEPEPNRHARVGAGRGGGGFPPHPGREQRGPRPPGAPAVSFSPPFPGAGGGGTGRGGPASQYQMQQEQQQPLPPPPEPNRHVRVGRPLSDGSWGGGGPASRYGMEQPELVIEPEEEVGRRGRAPQWRSPPPRQPRPEGQWVRAGAGGGRGMEGGRGRGRGRGMERGRGRGRGRRDEESRRMIDLRVGNDADGELFASRVGFEVKGQLEEAFDEVISKTMPSPVEEAYLNAVDLNCRLEFEPEFLMGDLDSNPDIDDKEPIPLRDALEKVKPFLMAYEGIENHEEWEEIVEETIERVPALKKIVDHYSGPDRVTAKKQTEELEKVAKTLPETVPDSIKQFTDRAVLSLQSNPGWGFHQKRQFMDKLVSRMSQHYK